MEALFTGLAKAYPVHPIQVTNWKRQGWKRGAVVFDSIASGKESVLELQGRHAKVGQQALEVDVLESTLIKAAVQRETHPSQ